MTTLDLFLLVQVEDEHDELAAEQAEAEALADRLADFDPTFPWKVDNEAQR